MYRWSPRVRESICAALAIAAAGAFVLADAANAGKSKSESQQIPYTSDFRLDDCSFESDDTNDGLGNAYFPLVPGQWKRLEGEEKGAEIRVDITVCDDACEGAGYGVAGDGTRLVDGVTTRVVREEEWEDDELVEVSWNYFARCTRNGGVFYFGEDVDDYEDDSIVGHEGAWLAGSGENEAGLIMPGNVLVGSRYYQEFAPDIALDRADHTADDLDLELDLYDPFEDCVAVAESSDLHASDASFKVYCPNVGLVVDDEIELVQDNFVP